MWSWWLSSTNCHSLVYECRKACYLHFLIVMIYSMALTEIPMITWCRVIHTIRNFFPILLGSVLGEGKECSAPQSSWRLYFGLLSREKPLFHRMLKDDGRFRAQRNGAPYSQTTKLKLSLPDVSPTNQLTNRLTNWPVNKSKNQSANQSLNQPIIQPISKQTSNQAANQSNNQLTKQSTTNQLTNQPNDQILSQRSNQATSNLMNI